MLMAFVPRENWKNSKNKEVLLLDSLYQRFGIHSCVPDVNYMNSVFYFVIVVYELKSPIHNMAKSVLKRLIT